MAISIRAVSRQNKEPENSFGSPTQVVGSKTVGTSFLFSLSTSSVLACRWNSWEAHWHPYILQALEPLTLLDVATCLSLQVLIFKGPTMLQAFYRVEREREQKEEKKKWEINLWVDFPMCSTAEAGSSWSQESGTFWIWHASWCLSGYT